jgi:hypothetical protein
MTTPSIFQTPDGLYIAYRARPVMTTDLVARLQRWLHGRDHDLPDTFQPTPAQERQLFALVTEVQKLPLMWPSDKGLEFSTCHGIHSLRSRRVKRTLVSLPLPLEELKTHWAQAAPFARFLPLASLLQPLEPNVDLRQNWSEGRRMMDFLAQTPLNHSPWPPVAISGTGEGLVIYEEGQGYLTAQGSFHPDIMGARVFESRASADITLTRKLGLTKPVLLIARIRVEGMAEDQRNGPTGQLQALLADTEARHLLEKLGATEVARRLQELDQIRADHPGLFDPPVQKKTFRI